MSSPEQAQFVTPSELSLLRASLLEGSAATEAANSWLGQLRNGEARLGFRGLELASRRLLPLVYRNVKTSIAPSLRDQLRQIHHEYWADNQKRFYRLQELLSWFEANDIPTLVLKGMALSRLYYRDMALRPTSDFDILVPEDRAPEVVRRLQREGWAATYYLPSAPNNSYFFRHTHAMPLTRPDYGDLDLHWHVLSHATFRGADQPFWSGSVPLVVNTIQTRALNPTHQLLHACVHGFSANAGLAPIRWIADAVTILRTSQIEWASLVDLARDLHVTIPLGATLSFLRATFPAPIPEDAVEKLKAEQIDHAERRYFERLVHYNADWREVLTYNLERLRRANRDRHPMLRAAFLPQQLQLHYNLSNLNALGSFALSRLGKRIRGGMGHL